MDRPLLLNGFMATGKSELGKRVAALSGHPFVDLDELIQDRAGKSVAELFRERGEAGFRALERAELEALLKAWRSRYSEPPVVALGGGALLHRPLRCEALRGATVITLTASLTETLRRAAGDANRPLLANADARFVETLLELRRPSYLEAHACLDTTAVDPGAIDPIALARRALELWARRLVAVAAGERSYAVEIGQNLVPERLPEFVSDATRVLVVTDTTVRDLHAAGALRALERAGASATLVTLEPGETHKNVDGLEHVWRAAFDAGADRKSLILALGGGVVSDLAGFAAATWLRGVRWIAIPTTLLGMVDASVGGKTGVDFDVAKNAIGAFHQPRAVLASVEHVTTETDRAYRSALAEVVKSALIGDPHLFSLLENQTPAVLERDLEAVEELVRRSVAVKAAIVSEDERESGLRAVLNLGHTFGHALESDAGFARLTHGEAIAQGLGVALRLGVDLGATPRELSLRVEALLEKLGLPPLPTGAELRRALAALGHDKKRVGTNLRFVVATDVGKVETPMVPLAELVCRGEELARTLS